MRLLVATLLLGFTAAVLVAVSPVAEAQMESPISAETEWVGRCLATEWQLPGSIHTPTWAEDGRLSVSDLAVLPHRNKLTLDECKALYIVLGHNLGGN